MKRSFVWVFLAVIAGAIIFSGCAQAPESDTGAPEETVTLNGAGASFPYPLYSKWFGEYSRAYPRVRINYQSIGSGGGIQQLKAGTVDFGASDAPLSDEDMAEMPGEVVHLPMVAGAVVIAYNLPELEETLHLSGEVISAIYRGEITHWNDAKLKALNPEHNMPETAIAPIFRADGSGTTYIFTHYLAAACDDWAQQVGSGKSVSWPTGIGGKGNEGIAGLIKQTPGGLGYVELAYAEQNALSYAQVKNAAGNFIEPNLASTTAAAAGAAEAMKEDIRLLIVNAPGNQAYPIAGFTYILVYKEQKDANQGAALIDLLTWTVQAGQSYAEPLLYAPLPEEIREINEKTIRAIVLPQ